MVHFFITTALFLVSFLSTFIVPGSFKPFKPIQSPGNVTFSFNWWSVQFVNDVELQEWEQPAVLTKDRIEEYLKKRRLKAMILKNPSVQSLVWRDCGSWVVWWVAVISQLRLSWINCVNPHLCKDHMKLLRFLSIYPEFFFFSEYFACLKRDRSRFIEPMKRMCMGEDSGGRRVSWSDGIGAWL